VPLLRRLDDFMILDEQTFRIGTDQITLLVYFEFFFVLNHGEEIQDCPKGEVLKKKKILKHIVFLGRIRRVVGTCSRKPHILF